MQASFVQWDTAVVKHGAVVMRLNDVDRRHALADGESFEAIFPAKANFDFDPDLKRNTVLVDFMLNKEDVLLCSERVKDFVQARHPARLEYLPVTVLDHKGQPVGAPYFILHPVDPPDCIDRANSKLTMSDFDPDDIWEAEHLAIDESKVPAERLIFRPKAYNSVILLRRELAQDLVAAGFTGAGWKEIA